jgi:hypothetical protein
MRRGGGGDPRWMGGGSFSGGRWAHVPGGRVRLSIQDAGTTNGDEMSDDQSPGQVLSSFSGEAGLAVFVPDWAGFNNKVTRLAERLGVPSAGPGVGYVLSGNDGKSYSVMDLAHAFLDKIEVAAPKQ